MEQELNRLIQPALEVVRFILSNKGLGKSDLLRLTDIVITGEKLEVIMPSYAVFVDRGRRAGKFPPLSAIIGWIREKNIAVPKEYTLEQFAFLIGRKISKKGTQGKNFLEVLADRLLELSFDFINKQIDEKIKQI